MKILLRNVRTSEMCYVFSFGRYSIREQFRSFACDIIEITQVSRTKINQFT